MTITFAHRGGRADLAENTLPAFERALAHGATGLETDAWCTGDKKVALVHDQTRWVLRARFIPWKINIGKSSAQQLARFEIPTLDDLYSTVGIDYELSIDCKEPAVSDLIVEVARRHGASERLWLCDYSTTRLKQLRKKFPEVNLVNSKPKRKVASTMERHAADLSDAGIDAMNMHQSEWTPGLVALFHRFKVKVFAWDVQEVRHLRAMLALGVDAVYCDHVDRMVDVIA